MCIKLSACLPEFILMFFFILYKKIKNIIMFLLKEADKFWRVNEYSWLDLILYYKLEFSSSKIFQ